MGEDKTSVLDITITETDIEHMRKGNKVHWTQHYPYMIRAEIREPNRQETQGE